jgi:predicted AAA+ superfamily ATPase
MARMLRRTHHLARLESLLGRYPIVCLLGARQVGKTTLARQLLARHTGPRHFFDLESPADVSRLSEPELALGPLEGLVVLDEIQRLPELFPVLRVLADRPASPASFLVLGSASPDLLRQSSESLAGRVIYQELGPFALDEVGQDNLDDLWIRGGFPRSFLAASEADSSEWRRAFLQTFLERDLPQLGVSIPATTMRRFWTMLAHYHGRIWNSSQFASSFGVADTTVRRYLDLMTSALVVRQLPPWIENVGKRQVKSPKVYIRDSGLLHCLLDLESREEVESHPQLGASWEGFLLSEVAARLGARPDQCFFWATHAGAELDLLVRARGRKLGFEIKRTSTPKVTKSLRSAIETLHLDRAFVIHAGHESFPLAEGVEAVSARRLLHDLEPLG